LIMSFQHFYRLGASRPIPSHLAGIDEEQHR
jgi:hypothetical protein